MNSDYGTDADKLAHADLLQKQVLERQRNADELVRLWNLGNAIFKDVASGGPMTESVDRVEKRARLRSLENVPEMKPQSVLLEIWELRRELGE